jgi:TatA/E family protein of Tat protein translocase
MFGLGISELLIIFCIFFLLFGAKNIPEIARSMGKAIFQFKRGVNDIEKEITSVGSDISRSINKNGSST